MMTGREIGERFIRAVQITEHIYGDGPTKTRAAWMDVIHSQADKNGWGAERIEAERKAFWNSINNAPKPWEISEAEETLSWVSFVDKEDERLALMAWSRCMATEAIFKDWCKANSIASETGRRRKERAILRIMLAKGRKPLQHNDIDVESLLPDEPILGDKTVILADDAPLFWRDQSSKPLACNFDTDLAGFDWAQKRNELRRKRETAAR